MYDIGWNRWNINDIMIIVWMFDDLIWWLLIVRLSYDLRDKYNINLVKMKVNIKIVK